MAGEEDRASSLRCAAHHRLKRALDQRIEAGAGLVQDEHLGSVHESLDQPDLLAIAGRQIAHLPGQVGVESLGELVDVGPVDAAPQVREVRESISTGELGIQRQIAGHVADVPADLHGLLPGVQTKDRSPPPRRPDLIEQRPDGRRLAGAVGAQEPEHLAGPDVEVQVLQRPHTPIVLGEPLGVDRGLSVHPAPSPAWIPARLRARGRPRA